MSSTCPFSLYGPGKGTSFTTHFSVVEVPGLQSVMSLPGLQAAEPFGTAFLCQPEPCAHSPLWVVHSRHC